MFSRIIFKENLNIFAIFPSIFQSSAPLRNSWYQNNNTARSAKSIFDCLSQWQMWLCFKNICNIKTKKYLHCCFYIIYLKDTSLESNKILLSHALLKSAVFVSSRQAGRCFLAQSWKPVAGWSSISLFNSCIMQLMSPNIDNHLLLSTRKYVLCDCGCSLPLQCVITSKVPGTSGSILRA